MPQQPGLLRYSLSIIIAISARLPRYRRDILQPSPAHDLFDSLTGSAREAGLEA